MKKSIPGILCLFIGLFFMTTLMAGGGWPQPKGNGYFKLGQTAIISDRYYDPSGQVINITTVGFYTTSLYSEYGITDRWTLLGHFPIFVRNTLNKLESETSGFIRDGDSFNGFGDIKFGAKYNFLNKGSWALSAFFQLGLPTGQNVGGETELMQTGDGEFNQILGVEASTGLPFGYLNLLLAYNNRTNADYNYSSGNISSDFSDEFRWGAEIGGTINNKWFLALNALHVIPTENVPPNTTNTSIFGNKVSYLALTPKIGYFLNDRWGVEINTGFALAGENILASPSYQFGVFHVMK